MLDSRIKPQTPNAKYKKIAIITLILIGVLSIFTILFFSISSTINKPNSSSTESKYFVVKSGESLDEITNSLSDEKLIKNKFVFGLYLKYKGLSGKVQAGEYQIPMNLNMVDLSQVITLGKVVTTKITIPEGWTNQKIQGRITANTIINSNDWESAVKYDPEKYKYDFLKELKKGDSLEGFLYPDTYQVSLKPTADDIVKKMLDNFNKKLSNDDREQIKKSGMNTFEVVTLASIVEREAIEETDRKLVAGVFEKRLEIGMPLQSDITVLYALNSTKKNVTWEDTQVDSPYNTYKISGLPLGAVCNPSIQSIQAVLYPTKSNYLYFLAAPDGVIYYSSTVEGHNINKVKYL